MATCVYIFFTTICSEQALKVNMLVFLLLWLINVCVYVTVISVVFISERILKIGHILAKTMNNESDCFFYGTRCTVCTMHYATIELCIT